MAVGADSIEDFDVVAPRRLRGERDVAHDPVTGRFVRSSADRPEDQEHHDGQADQAPDLEPSGD